MLAYAIEASLKTDVFDEVIVSTDDQEIFEKTEALLKESTMFTARSILFEMDERFVQDIDTVEDWKMAELKYKMIKIEGLK